MFLSCFLCKPLRVQFDGVSYKNGHMFTILAKVLNLDRNRHKMLVWHIAKIIKIGSNLLCLNLIKNSGKKFLVLL